ncbi:MAG: hypothetical protein IT364_05570 [Candidatus Hydrogenedentes bacterium]|nr:hypothetical protein [Candidatus Hydrogenedentota bacterium]
MFWNHSSARALALGATLLCAAMTARADVALEEGNGKRWFKGVTHFHTLWSDGDCAPEVAVQWYQSHGYDFICISDHNILQTGEKWFPIDNPEDKRLPMDKVEALRKEFGQNWVIVEQRDGKPMMRLKTLSELQERFQQPDRFLVIPGEEVTAEKAVHINAVNTREVIVPIKAETPAETLQKNLDAIEAHGHEHNVPLLVHINHPNWSSTMTAEEIVSVGGERFFEVYNGHGGVRNWGDPAKHITSTDRLWDIILSLRLGNAADTSKPMYAVATDDAHNWFYQGPGQSIPGRGWIMVLAESLTAESLIEACKRGDVYPTSGVLFDSIRVENGAFNVAIRAEEGVTYTTQFIGTRKGADLHGEPVKDENGNAIRATHVYSDQLGTVLHETSGNPAVYTFKGDELYVRAKVVSSKLKVNPFKEGDYETAWTQPVAVK